MRSRLQENRGAVTMSFLGDAGQVIETGLIEAVEQARSPVLLIPRVAGYQAACGVDFDVTRMVPLASYLRSSLDAARTLSLMMQLRTLLKTCIEHRLPLKNVVMDDTRAFFDPWTSSVRFAFLPFSGIEPNAIQTRSYLASFAMKLHPADEDARALVARYEQYFKEHTGLDPLGFERYLGTLALDSLSAQGRRAAPAGGVAEPAEEDEVASDRPTGDVSTPAPPVGTSDAASGAAAPASATPEAATPPSAAASAAAPGEAPATAPESLHWHAAGDLSDRRVVIPEAGIPGALHTKTSEQAARAQEMAERTRAKVAEWKDGERCQPEPQPVEARGTAEASAHEPQPMDERGPEPAAAPEMEQPATTVLDDAAMAQPLAEVAAAHEPAPAAPAVAPNDAEAPGTVVLDDAGATPIRAHDAGAASAEQAFAHEPTEVERPAIHEPAPAAPVAPRPQAAAPAVHDWDDFDEFVDDGAPLTGVLGDLDGFFVGTGASAGAPRSGTQVPYVQRPESLPDGDAHPQESAQYPSDQLHPAGSAPIAPGPTPSPRPDPARPAPEPPRPQARFYLTHRRTGKHVEVAGPSFVVGKSKYTDFQVPGTTTVSRRHALFHVVGDTCTIEDNSSLNGTFVDGTRLSPRERMALVGGERIRLADEEFTFEAQRPAHGNTR